MRAWVYDPHSGGVKIPQAVKQRITERVRVYAESHYKGKYTRLDVRFRGALCYIDVYTDLLELPSESDLLSIGETAEQYLERVRNVPLHLYRLRYFGKEDEWSMALYTYSQMKYEPSIFNNGSFLGTPEEAIETSAVYLQ